MAFNNNELSNNFANNRRRSSLGMSFLSTKTRKRLEGYSLSQSFFLDPKGGAQSWERNITGRKSSKQKGLEQDARDLEVSNELREGVLGSASIDETTRGELLDMLDVSKYGRVSTSGYLNANALFERARSGKDPMYRSRLYIQEKIRMMKEQPGRDQLVLTGRSPVAVQAERILIGDMSDLGGNR